MGEWEWGDNDLVSESGCRENDSPRNLWWLSSHQAGRGLKICQGFALMQIRDMGIVFLIVCSTRQ